MSCYFITIVEIFHVLIFVMMHEGERCICSWWAVAYAVLSICRAKAQIIDDLSGKFLVVV